MKVKGLKYIEAKKFEVTVGKKVSDYIENSKSDYTALHLKYISGCTKRSTMSLCLLGNSCLLGLALFNKVCHRTLSWFDGFIVKLESMSKSKISNFYYLQEKQNYKLYNQELQARARINMH
ncbi:MAG: hypothetical protein R3B45_02935 [Bdellovibrionota bacterium]